MLKFTRHTRGAGASRYYWVSANLDGNAVARTETYSSTSSCDNAVDAAKRGRLKYEVFKGADAWRFRMVGLNGQIVFQGTETYRTSERASAVANKVKAQAPTAEYVQAALA